MGRPRSGFVQPPRGTRAENARLHGAQLPVTSSASS